MHVGRARALSREVHVVVVVAVAALERIVRFQPRPFVLRELQALVQKTPRVCGAEDLPTTRKPRPKNTLGRLTTAQ